MGITMRYRRPLTFVLSLSCAAAAAPPINGRLLTVGLSQPVYVTHMPGHPSALHVVQRGGLIRIVDAETGAISPAPFLDLRSVVRVVGDGGLLCAAFAPDFSDSGFVYVYYTGQPDSGGTIARYSVDPVTRLADPGSAHIVLRYSRPANGHNGGWIGFSPRDGMLYLAAGDGGTAANPDPTNAAQTLTGNIQGKILRIDPRSDGFPADDDRNYAVPPDNPFVGLPGDDEIWAYGLRNPWRCSFDRATGDLWIADVGQADYEEINIETVATPPGRNYGWRCLEGPRCTNYDGCVCQPEGTTSPAFAYNHAVGQSITGGYVYRGGAIPGLVGSYVFADFQTPGVFVLSPSLMFEDVTAGVDPGDPRIITSPASFGEDEAGELYIVNFFEGTLIKLVPPSCPADFNGDGGVDGGDIEAFYLAWEPADPSADVNHDGGIDGADVAFFFIVWEAGGCG